MLSTEGEECDRDDATKFTKQIGPVCAKSACDYLDFDFSFIKIWLRAPKYYELEDF